MVDDIRPTGRCRARLLLGWTLATAGFVGPLHAQPGPSFWATFVAGPYTEPLVARVVLDAYSSDLWSGWAFELEHDPAATLEEVVESAALLSIPLDYSLIVVGPLGFSVEAMHAVPLVVPPVPPEESHLYEATYTVTAPSDVVLAFNDALLFLPGGGTYTVGTDAPTLRFLPPFLRGDANRDGAVDLADFVRQFQRFAMGSTANRQCDDAFDFNDDGEITIADIWATLAFLFSGGAAPPLPYPECGFDTTDPSPECGDWACP